MLLVSKENVSRQAGSTFPFFTSVTIPNHPKPFSLPHSTKPLAATIDDVTKPLNTFIRHKCPFDNRPNHSLCESQIRQQGEMRKADCTKSLRYGPRVLRHPPESQVPTALPRWTSLYPQSLPNHTSWIQITFIEKQITPIRNSLLDCIRTESKTKKDITQMSIIQQCDASTYPATTNPVDSMACFATDELKTSRTHFPILHLSHHTQSPQTFFPATFYKTTCGDNRRRN